MPPEFFIGLGLSSILILFLESKPSKKIEQPPNEPIAKIIRQPSGDEIFIVMTGRGEAFRQR